MVTVEAVDHIVLTVRDVTLSAEWYVLALGMERRDYQLPTGEKRISLVFGRNKIKLRPASVLQEEWFTAREPRVASADLCFLTQSTPDEVADHFRRCEIDIVLGPVTTSGACGPIRSVYAYDPDGNLIEVSSYLDI